MARPGEERQGEAGLSLATQATQGWAWSGVSRRGKTQRGRRRYARQGAEGEQWCGPARDGEAGMARRRKVRLGKARFGVSRLGKDSHGMAWQFCNYFVDD